MKNLELNSISITVAAPMRRSKMQFQTISKRLEKCSARGPLTQLETTTKLYPLALHKLLQVNVPQS